MKVVAELTAGIGEEQYRLYDSDEVFHLADGQWHKTPEPIATKVREQIGKGGSLVRTVHPASNWKVEGNGRWTKIVVNCPACNSGATLHGAPESVVRKRFKHNGCKGRVEAIPTETRDEYWQRAVVSQY